MREETGLSWVRPPFLRSPSPSVVLLFGRHGIHLEVSGLVSLTRRVVSSPVSTTPGLSPKGSFVPYLHTIPFVAVSSPYSEKKGKEGKFLEVYKKYYIQKRRKNHFTGTLGLI